jgi:EpsI family protein
MMSRHFVFSAIALALFGLAGLLLFTGSEATERRLAFSLDSIPTRAGEWTAAGVPPIEVFRPDPGAEVLFRAYRRRTSTIWLAVGYYPSQDETRRAVAGELVLPGRGWNEGTEHAVTIPTPGLGTGKVAASRVFLRSDQSQIAVLYWYQLPGRTTRNDHEYRARLLYNRLVHHRADAALVRVGAPVLDERDLSEVASDQIDFIQAFYGQLLAILPR